MEEQSFLFLDSVTRSQSFDHSLIFPGCETGCMNQLVCTYFGFFPHVPRVLGLFPAGFFT